MGITESGAVQLDSSRGLCYPICDRKWGDECDKTTRCAQFLKCCNGSCIQASYDCVEEKKEEPVKEDNSFLPEPPAPIVVPNKDEETKPELKDEGETTSTD